MRKAILKTAVVFMLTLAAGFSGRAADSIPVIGTSGAPGLTPPIWVSISGLSGEASEVLRFDLYVQGFNFTNAESAQYIISASSSGSFQARATDRIGKNTLVSKAYSGGSLRRQVHTFVDEFTAAVDQRKGICLTKIAFKSDAGRNSEISIADFDGSNPQQVTHDNTIVAAPAWAGGKMMLYYSSYKLGNPAIFSHDLTSGARNKVAWYGGSSISPAVSADGRKVAMILSKGGSPDVYVSDAEGGNLKRLTSTREDESSPCFSPDGQWICFAGKISERRALYKVPAAGGPIQRIATSGVSNPTEPDWSPDGKWIVFTRQSRDFEICIVPASGGEVTVLVPGEDPSWSANSRTVVFTRRQGGDRGLSLLDVFTKQVKDVARISGSNSQPSWAR
jgi:TolB protein